MHRQGVCAYDQEFDVSDTLAAVLRAEPDWTALPRDVPGAVRELIQRALVKDHRQRIGDIAVALFVLSGERASSSDRSADREPRTRARGRLAIRAATLTAAVALAAGGWWVGARSNPPAPTVVTRFVVPLPDGESFLQAGRNLVAASPDGTSLAYVASRGLLVRRFDSLEATLIVGGESSPGPVGLLCATGNIGNRVNREHG